MACYSRLEGLQRHVTAYGQLGRQCGSDRKACRLDWKWVSLLLDRVEIDQLMYLQVFRYSGPSCSTANRFPDHYIHQGTNLGITTIRHDATRLLRRREARVR